MTEAEPRERDEGVDSCRATRQEASSHRAARCSEGHRRLKDGGTRRRGGVSVRPKPMPMGATEGEQGVKGTRCTGLGDQSRCDGDETRAKTRVENECEGRVRGQRSS